MSVGGESKGEVSVKAGKKNLEVCGKEDTPKRQNATFFFSLKNSPE